MKFYLAYPVELKEYLVCRHMDYLCQISPKEVD